MSRPLIGWSGRLLRWEGDRTHLAVAAQTAAEGSERRCSSEELTFHGLVARLVASRSAEDLLKLRSGSSRQYPRRKGTASVALLKLDPFLYSAALLFLQSVYCSVLLFSSQSVALLSSLGVVHR